MKASPCTALDCMSLNLRANDAPAPVLCPRCGRDTLLRPPAPTSLATLRDAVARRVFVDGDESAL